MRGTDPSGYHLGLQRGMRLRNQQSVSVPMPWFETGSWDCHIGKLIPLQTRTAPRS